MSRIRLCRWFRSKVLHGGVGNDEDVLMAGALLNKVPCRCLITCEPFGPDDRMVAPETCGPERDCYVSRVAAEVSDEAESA